MSCAIRLLIPGPTGSANLGATLMYLRIPQSLSLSPFFSPTRIPSLSRSPPTRGLRSTRSARSAAVNQALGVLRQMGEGVRRNLLCGFCLCEWEFRRIVCPGCDEKDHAMLPVYTAGEFPYIRVECCDTWQTYLKSIDLSKHGLADPLVDELAYVPSTSGRKSADIPSSIPTCWECDYFCNSTTNFGVPGL
jgi:Protein involved in formate dehydrogenase formation